MKGTTYKTIKLDELYSVRATMRILGYSRAFLFSKIRDGKRPLRYVVDNKTRMMKFEGSELIRYFHIKV